MKEGRRADRVEAEEERWTCMWRDPEFNLASLSLGITCFFPIFQMGHSAHERIDISVTLELTTDDV